MLESNSSSFPLEKSPITTDECIQIPLSANVPYREAARSLMFLAIVIRPGISYVVGVLSLVLNKYQQVHWNIVKRTVRYLKGTQKCGIVFHCNSEHYASII